MVGNIFKAIGIIVIGFIVIVVVAYACSDESPSERVNEPVYVPEPASTTLLATLGPTTSPTLISTQEPMPTSTRLPTPTFTLIPTPTLLPDFYDLRGQSIEGITYDELHRNVEEYIGKMVYFMGEVNDADESVGEEYWDEKNQKYAITEPGHDYDVLVAITYKPATQFWAESYEDVIHLQYNGPRLLTRDLVEFVGMVEGIETDWMDIPTVKVIALELVTKAGDRK